MLYLYARVSTDRQENGRDAQVNRLKSWAGDREVAGVFVDEDVSALSVRLQDRPEGKKMWEVLAPGDVVACTKMDRMFRRLADMASTIDAWKHLGIRLQLLDMDVDIESPHGRAFAGFTAVAAQLESELHGQRKREVYAYKRQTGQPYNQTRPFGWVATRARNGKLDGWAVCEAERATGKRVLAMRRQGMSHAKIASVLCLEGVQKPVRRRGSSGYYHVQDIFCLARAAQAGYPRLPREFWQAPGCEQRLREATGHGAQLST